MNFGTKMLSSLALCLALLVAACAPSAPAGPSSTSAKPAGGTADDMASVYEAAKREGKVTFYTTITQDDLEALTGKFKARYPGVDVEYVRLASEPLIERLLTEAKSGQQLADVVETGDFSVYELEKAGLLGPVDLPEAANLPEAMRRSDKLWYADRIVVAGIAWNKNLVTDPPLTFDELTDPKWAGKLIADPTDFDALTTIALQKFKSEDKTRAWVQGVARNKPQLLTDHTRPAQLMAAGGAEVFGAFAFYHTVQTLIDQGAPLAYSLKEGVIKQQVSAKFAKAPHPNAARLFMNWIIGTEAQGVFRDRNRVPAREDVTMPFQILPETKYYTNLDVIKQAPIYDKMWREALGVN